MAIAYTTNTLVWLTDSKKWKLTMEVNASVQKGVSLWPFVVEKFISEEDLLDGSSVATKEVIIDRLTGEAGGSYPYPLFRRVSLQEDLKTIDTVDVLAGVLKAKQESRFLEDVRFQRIPTGSNGFLNGFPRIPTDSNGNQWIPTDSNGFQF